MECVACRRDIGKQHCFREMMFGTRDEFLYWECLTCGCLQIATVPEHLEEYYPSNYYAFTLEWPAWKRWYYRAHFAAPRFMNALRPCSKDVASVIAAGPMHNARILDVGCGGGALVETLRFMGFDAQGIDPFIKATKSYIRRAYLDEVEGGWDLIMFHHSLEHMPNHVEMLRCARSKLSVGGNCLVRIPVVNWAWEHYGRDWAQLDVPRHLVIHTPRSFQLTANAAEFHIERTIFDSNEFQFYASELYQRDLSLHGREAVDAFSQSQMRKFRDQADDLNRQQLGDQAAFFMSASTDLKADVAGDRANHIPQAEVRRDRVNQVQHRLKSLVQPLQFGLCIHSSHSKHSTDIGRPAQRMDLC